jgi:microcystin-dependent protein
MFALLGAFNGGDGIRSFKLPIPRRLDSQSAA